MEGDKQESSSLSDSSDGGPATSAQSDPEVMLLATSRPKKRAGRRIFKETRHPVFRGVRRRNGDKWVCELREPNKKSRIWLGTYPTPEMAARAHDVAALALRGKSACFNFADSPWRLPVPASMDARDIREAAMEAAELFRPQEFGGKERLDVDVVDDSNEGCSDKCMNRTKDDKLMFMDEEAEFDMPKLLLDMAEGLLLSPPQHLGGSVGWDEVESFADFSLWNY